GACNCPLFLRIFTIYLRFAIVSHNTSVTYWSNNRDNGIAMAIRWDQFPHERILLQIYSRLARNDVARSSEDSLRRILQRRLPSRNADDHRRFIEIEARTLVEHLRCTGTFIASLLTLSAASLELRLIG